MPSTRHIQIIVFLLPAIPKKHKDTDTAGIRTIQTGWDRLDMLPARIPVIMVRQTGISGGIIGCDSNFTCVCFLTIV